MCDGALPWGLSGSEADIVRMCACVDSFIYEVFLLQGLAVQLYGEKLHNVDRKQQQLNRSRRGKATRAKGCGELDVEGSVTRHLQKKPLVVDVLQQILLIKTRERSWKLRYFDRFRRSAVNVRLGRVSRQRVRRGRGGRGRPWRSRSRDTTIMIVLRGVISG